MSSASSMSSSSDDDGDELYVGGRVISDYETSSDDDDFVNVNDGEDNANGADEELAQQSSPRRQRRAGRRSAFSRAFRKRIVQLNSFRKRILQLSDSDDESDEDSSSGDEERTGEDGANEVDEASVFLETMTSARDLAQALHMKKKKAATDAPADASITTPVRGKSSSVTMISNVIHEIGSGAVAVLTSPKKFFVGDAAHSDAGYIVVRVRAVRSLLGLFVRVHLETGHNLLAMDSGNTSDPYVKVSLLDSSGQKIEGQEYTTPYSLKTLNPVFNVSFFLGDVKLAFKDCKLKFDVFDFDIMSSDDLMGSAELPLHFISTPLEVPVASAAHVQFRYGVFEWTSHSEIRAHLNLVQESTSSHVYNEAIALLSFAKSLLNPRNIGKSLVNTSVANWLNAKIEQAIDIGKRKALRSIDSVITEKKAALTRKVKSDRDMPAPVANYISGIVNMYASDIQRSVMRDLSMRLKITDSASTRSYKSGLQLQQAFRKRSMIISLLRGFRAWFLRNECPYDMTVWGKLRNPWWWILLGCKLWYGLGVQAALFFLRLLLVDKKDEWQMFHFILAFKGVQFLSGVIAIFTGVFAFIHCAGIIDDGEAHTCSVAGPWYTAMQTCTIGLDKCVSLNTASYVFQILMCWYAFRKLKKSFAFGRAIAGDEALVGGRIEITLVKSGRKYQSIRLFKRLRSKGKKEAPLQRFRRAVERQLMLIRTSKAQQPTNPGFFKEFHYVRRIAKVKAYNASTDIHTIYFRDDQSRKLREIDLDTVTYRVVKLKKVEPRRAQRILFGYEVLSFIFTAAISVRFLEFIDWGRGETWKVYGIAFWAQTFYNLLAFPFILAVIPGLQKLVCHAARTGYDENGKLRAFVTRPGFKPLGEEPNPRSRIMPAFYPLSKRLRI